MKTQLTSLAISAMILSTATFSFPANTPGTNGITKLEQAESAAGFAFFRTHRQGKGITAIWGITSSTGVVGFSLQKTYEDPSDPYSNWEEVSSTACNGARSYKCTDNNVFPGFISYRVIAQLIDGSTIASGIETARIVSH